jgi:ammonium transporter, Amt family
MDFDDYSFWMFQYAFSAASATIVAGTLAERCQMAAYLCYSLLLAGFVYPVVSHSIWDRNGFLSSAVAKENPIFGSGVVDFAGGGVVHLTGGTTALFATMILGPRRGRFHDDEGRKLDKPKHFPGHSIALQVCSHWQNEKIPHCTIPMKNVLILLTVWRPRRCWVRLFFGLVGTGSMQAAL